MANVITAATYTFQVLGLLDRNHTKESNFPPNFPRNHIILIYSNSSRNKNLLRSRTARKDKVSFENFRSLTSVVTRAIHVVRAVVIAVAVTPVQIARFEKKKKKNVTPPGSAQGRVGLARQCALRRSCGGCRHGYRVSSAVSQSVSRALVRCAEVCRCCVRRGYRYA